MLEDRRLHKKKKCYNDDDDIVIAGQILYSRQHVDYIIFVSYIFI